MCGRRPGDQLLVGLFGALVFSGYKHAADVAGQKPKKAGKKDRVKDKFAKRFKK